MRGHLGHGFAAFEGRRGVAEGHRAGAPKLGPVDRQSHGEILTSIVEDTAILCRYLGLDGIGRQTRFEFSPAAELSPLGRKSRRAEKNRPTA